jgi:acyl-coenzyme A synthetase/AMP-(fatty) acid ligase
VVVNSPMVHLGGLFRIIQSVTDGRKVVLLERFEVDKWIDAVRRHSPKTVSLVPAALRMVFDADLDPADFASVQSVVSGTAPLDPDLADAFTEKYGVPVLTSYAATEFGGGVAGWNLADYREFGRAKRGSVGRAHAGSALRVVDETTGAVLPNGEIGLLEVRTDQIDANQWIRTTDLARLDDDGFLWIVGRADQTILRGGFKVQPEVVRSVLLRHPDVVDAVVFGADDPRLGQVPVAVLQLMPDADLAELDMAAHAREHLAPYEVPVEIAAMPSLPRTPSQKVDLAAVKEWWATRP